jgi:hypothetical protein
MTRVPGLGAAPHKHALNQAFMCMVDPIERQC